MIAHFKNLVELKMNFPERSVRMLLLLAGGALTLWALSAPSVFAETEDVQVVERKPDETNPMYEIIEVEGGLFFRAPKDMTFVKKDGVIGPISTEEYCLRKFEGVAKQIKVLNQRVDALERNAKNTSGKKN
jgi:hypothetical protein